MSLLRFFLSFLVFAFLANEISFAQNNKLENSPSSNTETLPTNILGSVNIDDSLSVLSWNIYMLPTGIKFTGKRKRAKAIGDYFAKSHHEVLIIQEAFHHGARRKILSRIKSVYPHRVGPVFKQYFSIKTSSGIWILSKLPMKTLGKVRYSERWGFDNKMARKGAVMVEVEKDGQPFQIVGTHLNAGGPLEVRASQLRQIRDELIIPFYDPSKPLIVAGDMNISKSDKAGHDSLLTILDMKSYDLTGIYPYTVDYCMNDIIAARSEECDIIDYVFVKDKEKKVRRVERFIPLIEARWSARFKSLSDHNPIEMKIHFNKSAAKQ